VSVTLRCVMFCHVTLQLMPKEYPDKNPTRAPDNVSSPVVEPRGGSSMCVPRGRFAGGTSARRSTCTTTTSRRRSGATT
jgi:hypothetical protein